MPETTTIQIESLTTIIKTIIKTTAITTIATIAAAAVVVVVMRIRIFVFRNSLETGWNFN